ncbi:MAG: hypothetical protein IJK18_00515 [Clostridia bacterium]|nr:hypothetical protein [Clostridia bacterium]
MIYLELGGIVLISIYVARHLILRFLRNKMTIKKKIETIVGVIICFCFIGMAVILALFMPF